MPRQTALLLAACLALAASFSACSPAVTPAPASPTVPGLLTPYHTRTLTPSPSGAPPTQTPFPTATPTPVTYTVQKNDDMFGIALRYGVSLPALKTANPTVLPNFLSVGIVLVIPVTPPPPGAAPSPQASATPAPVTLDPPRCYPVADGGAWCLALARNTGDRGVENVTALFRISAGNQPAPLEQTAITPLNILPAKGVLPVAAFFPAPLAVTNVPAVPGAGAEAQLQAALPVPETDSRYLPATIEAANSPQLNPDRRSARVSAEVRLGSSSGPAAEIWVLAVAYGSGGEVVGWRKWESQGSLRAGEALPFEMVVYSLGPAIERVETYVEAHS